MGDITGANSMNESLNIICPILVENSGETEEIKSLVSDLNHNIKFVPDLETYPRENQSEPDLIIIEPSLFHWTWLKQLFRLRNNHPDVPILLFSTVATVSKGFAPLIEDEKIFMANEPTHIRDNLEQIIHPEKYRRRKILFVDDDENLLKSYQRMLRKANYQIFKVTSGEKAIELIERESVDLIVTDIRMPQMHGVELITRIRSQNNDIPIVVSSAAIGMREDDELKYHGVAAFIEKPVDEDVLQNTLATLLG